MSNQSDIRTRRPVISHLLGCENLTRPHWFCNPATFWSEIKLNRNNGKWLVLSLWNNFWNLYYGIGVSRLRNLGRVVKISFEVRLLNRMERAKVAVKQMVHKDDSFWRVCRIAYPRNTWQVPIKCKKNESIYGSGRSNPVERFSATIRIRCSNYFIMMSSCVDD